MLSENTVNTLVVITDLFKSAKINWRLIGSSNLYLQGVPVDPKDIDILISIEDVEKAQNALTLFTIEPLKYRESAQFRSYFGKFNINNTEIEVMSNLEILKDGTWHVNTVINSPAVMTNLGKVVVPCISLKDEYDGYVLMGRTEKAALIKNTLEVSLK